MQVTIKGCTGPVNTFVVEPFVPHKEEYYLCIQSNRLDIDVSFSTAGGVEIEENWDKVKNISISTATAITGEQVLRPACLKAHCSIIDNDHGGGIKQTEKQSCMRATAAGFLQHSNVMRCCCPLTCWQQPSLAAAISFVAHQQ